jgi:hypothetical protein
VKKRKKTASPPQSDNGPRQEAPAAQRPTKEARRHGHYVVPESRGAVAVYTNLHPNLLGKLRGHGTITPRQWAAGVAFEETYARVWGSASPSRDSTIPAVGGTSHETEAQAERWARAKARTTTILNRIGPARYSLLVSVVCFGMGLGGRDRGRNALAYEALREALDQCAVVYGISDAAA